MVKPLSCCGTSILVLKGDHERDSREKREKAYGVKDKEGRRRGEREEITQKVFGQFWWESQGETGGEKGVFSLSPLLLVGASGNSSRPILLQWVDRALEGKKKVFFFHQKTLISTLSCVASSCETDDCKNSVFATFPKLTFPY